MKRLLVSLIAFVFAVSAAGRISYAQKSPRLESKLANDSTIFTLKIDPKAEISPGKTFTATLSINIRQNASGWHLYSYKNSEDAIQPLRITLPDALTKQFKILAVTERAKPVKKYDENFEEDFYFMYDDYNVDVKLQVLPTATATKLPLQLLVRYQICDSSMCLPPRTFEVPMRFLGQKPIDVSIAAIDDSVGGAVADGVSSALSDSVTTNAVSPAAVDHTRTPGTAAASSAIGAEHDVVKLADQSIWKFLLAAAGFGLLALLTPCVFPMVPITVSFFTKRNAGSRKEALKDAIIYAGGIIVTFVALGFLLALIAGPAGINQFAANPWANLVIAGIFIAFALNLFGLFEIGVPSSVVNNLNMTAQKSKSRYVSVGLMGLVFSLTSFTCTVPFVGTLMVAFSRGAWFMPLLGMAVFASIFAMPFFILALFPSLMKALPRSGGWLNSVKVVMGFLEIGAALKFISNADLVWAWNIFSRDLVLAAWIALAIVTTMYLLGRFRLSHDTPVEHIGALRVIVAVLFLSGGVYLYTGFHGRPLGQLDAFLPPAMESASFLPTATQRGDGQVHSASEVRWHERYSDALAEAKRTNKNIFIDFTGYTCTNCRAMESTMFIRPEIREAFGDFVLARLYTDNGTPLNDSNRAMEEERFNTIALPYYVIISPNDEALGTFPGFTTSLDAFKGFLDPHRKAATNETLAAN